MKKKNKLMVILRKINTFLSVKGFFVFLSDEAFLKMRYRLSTGKKLDLSNPKTFNEKIQWLKIHNKNPEYTPMVDKVLVKEYVASVIGEEYVVPTIGVWDDPYDIDFDALPNQFVLKCNHDSGGNVICHNKADLDTQNVLKKLRKTQKRSAYNSGREWPYKNVKRKILAETYLEDAQTQELRDYKFFCFNGEAKLLFIASDRQTKGVETKFDFFDMNFVHLPIINGHPNSDEPPKKPENFALMQELACKLSKGIPHVRVDFYEVNGKVYFGELTFFHWGGFMPFEPEAWDEILGGWIDLSLVK